MSEIHKKNFVYSAKRLKYFFNNIKEGDLELVDQRAQVQQVSQEEYGSQEQLTQ